MKRSTAAAVRCCAVFVWCAFKEGGLHSLCLQGSARKEAQPRVAAGVESCKRATMEHCTGSAGCCSLLFLDD